jgi:alkanesulfonate monooxygenase SsuD/methylene tetrahydromethanopterin reductase-like flavin-dependent oxidoreductase (luciferase family)
VSGTVNPRVVARLARFGVGWIPWGPSAEDLRHAIPQMRDALAAAGREPEGLRVFGYLPVVTRDDATIDVARTMAAVPELVEWGITDLVASFVLPEDRAAARDELTRMVGAFRAAVGRPAHT